MSTIVRNVCSLVCVAGLAVGVLGCEKKTPAEKIGDKVEDLGDKAEDLGDKVQDKMGK